MPKFLIVAKYEYTRTVKSRNFWAITLLLPAFLALIMFVSGYSGSKGEEKLNKLPDDIKSILIFDETGFIEPEIISSTNLLFREDGLDKGIKKVKAGEFDALIHYPAAMITDGKFFIYLQDNDNLIGNTSLGTFAKNLIKESALSSLSPDKQILLTREFKESHIFFDDEGNIVNRGIEKFIVPIVSGIVFFFSVFIASQFLLQSVAEEKENRMIETLLSVINSKDLIYGKILGLSFVVLTQLTTWLILGGAIMLLTLNVFNFDVPLDIDAGNIDWELIPLNLYFIFMGFLFLAAIMVGTGSIGTSYKDSQSLASIFVLVSVFPIYLMMFIIAEPNGIIARILSFTPFTSPLLLMVRNSLDPLSPIELITGMVVALIYVALAFRIASALFNVGALMYNRKPKFREIIYNIKK